MKVLDLYSGIGGNRKLWQNVEVTAVEQNAEIAKIYSDFFPNDKMIVGDAHEYLLQHFAEYDFVWSSPPCPTHSKINMYGQYSKGYIYKYPDMSLYQEIIFLQHFAKGLWVVENVQPYYEPLIPAKESGRHLYWSNFHITNYPNKELLGGRGKPSKNEYDKFKQRVKQEFDIDIEHYQMPIHQKAKLLRNCVDPNLGLHVLNCALGAIPPMQEGLFAESESKKYV
jgi:DNA (cytosine-5)-methyltransferase 1